MRDLAQTADPFALGEPMTPPARIPVQPLRILALDLATRTGWAVLGQDGEESGMYDTAASKNAHDGQRWLNARAFLARTIVKYQPTVIYFEDVKSHSSNVGGRQAFNVMAAHVYGALKAFVYELAARNNIRVEAVGVGTIKKHFTGNGGAKKATMMDEARARGYFPRDDNEADAIAIRSYAIKMERGR